MPSGTAHFQCQDCNNHLGLIRLAPAISSSFNVTAAIEFFHNVSGLPYGWQNFLFGWIDTPNLNFPPPLTIELVQVLLPVVERVFKGSGKLWIDGFNLRMNTTGLNTSQIYDLLYQRNMTVGQLLPVPGQDSFIYPGVPAPGSAMVCSAFVTRLYKAADVFHRLQASKIQGTEFTPNDVFQLAIYDSHWQRPSQCLVDDLPFCQLSGRFLLELKGFNTVIPYAQMNELCQGIPPSCQRLQFPLDVNLLPVKLFTFRG
jgi:hypothetical protein